LADGPTWPRPPLLQGVSGNSNGRPRGRPDARPRLRALLAEVIAGNEELVRASLRAALKNPKLAVSVLELYARLNRELGLPELVLAEHRAPLTSIVFRLEGAEPVPQALEAHGGCGGAALGCLVGKSRPRRTHPLSVEKPRGGRPGGVYRSVCPRGFLANNAVSVLAGVAG
jgi:hypothetical protein